MLICSTALLQLDSGKKQKGLLAERIVDMELAAAAGEGDIRRARAELAELEVRLWVFDCCVLRTRFGGFPTNSTHA
jgi:hypothetical protein